MSAFAFAIDTIFLDPHMGLDAVYRNKATGEGTPCRVVRSAPDQIADFNGGKFVTDSVLIDVRLSDVPNPRPGDAFELEGSRPEDRETLVIIGDPTRDSERLAWKVECRAL